MSLTNREFLIRKERGGRERERGWREGQQADIFEVRLGLGEIEGRYRDIEGHRNEETETELTIKIPSKAG
jgi:hypothetical protein